MSAWFNYAAAIKILVFGLVVGAGLPALFAMGVPINAEGAGVLAGDAVAQRNPLVLAVSWLIFAVVLVAVTSVCCSSPATSSVTTPAGTSSAPSRRNIRPRRQAQVKLVPVPGVRSIRGTYTSCGGGITVWRLMAYDSVPYGDPELAA